MAKSRSVLPSKDLAGQTKFWFVDQPFEEKCPCVYEFLSTAMLDGEVRKGGSISVFASNGALKVCYLDKHTQMCFYSSLDPSKSLWDQLETILQGQHEPWQSVKKDAGKVPF